MAPTEYDAEFERYLINHNIFPEGFQYPSGVSMLRPNNLSKILRDLSAPRHELSHVPQSDFLQFQRMNSTVSRGTLLRKIIPVLEGGANILNDGQLDFDNFSPLMGGVATEIVPDYYDGVAFTAVHKKLRDALGSTIIPTRHVSAPVVPNFFLEVRRSSGNAVATKREICYYGAFGARAMCAVQDHAQHLYSKSSGPIYDGNAYTFSSTYIDGILRLYAHFIAAPSMPGGLPEFHMVELRVFNMMRSQKDFVDGCAVFRNARDLAAWDQNAFIERMNAIS